MSRVMIIESDLALQQSLSDAFSARDVSVLTSIDGAQALQLAKENKPNLFIIAVELPKQSGYSICNKIKKNTDMNGSAVFLISENATVEVFEQHSKLKSQRADAYFLKPFSIDEIIHEAANYISLGDDLYDGDQNTLNQEMPTKLLENVLPTNMLEIDAEVNSATENAFRDIESSPGFEQEELTNAVIDPLDDDDVINYSLDSLVKPIKAEAVKLPEPIENDLRKLVEVNMVTQNTDISRLEKSILANGIPSIPTIPPAPVSSSEISQPINLDSFIKDDNVIEDLENNAQAIEKNNAHQNFVAAISTPKDSQLRSVRPSSGVSFEADKEILELKGLVGDKDREILALREKVSDREHNVLNIKDELRNTEGRIGDLNAQLLKHEKEILSLREQSENSALAHQQFRDEKIAEIASIKELAESERKQEVEGLRVRHENTTSNLKNLHENTLETLRSEHTTAIATLENNRATENTRFSNQIGDLEEEIKGLRQNLEMARESIDERNRQIKEQEDYLATYSDIVTKIKEMTLKTPTR